MKKGYFAQPVHPTAAVFTAVVSGDIGAGLAGISRSAPPSSLPTRRSTPVSPPGEHRRVGVRDDDWRTVPPALLRLPIVGRRSSGLGTRNSKRPRHRFL